MLDLCFDFLARIGYVGLLSTYVSTVLNLSFGCARPMFRFSRPKSGMISTLCSTYLLNLLELCFGFPTEIGKVSTALDLGFNCARPTFGLSRPKTSMFRVYSNYVSTFSTAIGYVSTELDISFDCPRPISTKSSMFRLKTAPRPLTISRKTSPFRHSKSKHTFKAETYVLHPGIS